MASPYFFLLKPSEVPIHNFLDFIAIFQLFDGSVQALVVSLIGNSVKFGDGPAAVIGDESRNKPLLIFS
jgi:hypothetical protein